MAEEPLRASDAPWIAVHAGTYQRNFAGRWSMSRGPTASHRDLQGLLRDLADVLRRVTPFDRLAIVLHDPALNVMRLHTLAALQTPVTNDIELPIDESPAGVAWRTLTTARRAEHQPRDPLSCGHRDPARRGHEVVLRLLPLTSALRRLGGLSFASRNEDAFGEADIEFLQELASQVALAVDNVLHHDAAQHAQQELAARTRPAAAAARSEQHARLQPRAWRAVQCDHDVPAPRGRARLHDAGGVRRRTAGFRYVGRRVQRQGPHQGTQRDPG